MALKKIKGSVRNWSVLVSNSSHKINQSSFPEILISYQGRIHFEATLNSLMPFFIQDTPIHEHWIRFFLTVSFKGRACFFSAKDAINGHWSHWGAWTTCSASCDEGARSRTRLCNNPRPSKYGKPCKGEAKQEKLCTVGRCHLGEHQHFNICLLLLGLVISRPRLSFFRALAFCRICPICRLVLRVLSNSRCWGHRVWRSASSSWSVEKQTRHEAEMDQASVRHPDHGYWSNVWPHQRNR